MYSYGSLITQLKPKILGVKRKIYNFINVLKVSIHVIYL